MRHLMLPLAVAVAVTFAAPASAAPDWAAVDRALRRCERGWARLERTTDVEAHVRDLVAERVYGARQQAEVKKFLGRLRG